MANAHRKTYSKSLGAIHQFYQVYCQAISLCCVEPWWHKSRASINQAQNNTYAQFIWQWRPVGAVGCSYPSASSLLFYHSFLSLKGKKHFGLRGVVFGSSALNTTVLHSSAWFRHRSSVSLVSLSLSPLLFSGLLTDCCLKNFVLVSDPLSPQGLIKPNWAEWSWHWRDRGNRFVRDVERWRL